ncbi:hypothetical protein [Arthrobacter sp. NPDC057013]|uniref:hypothetical protein n=1 Tax=Arthrobacter sp. NPDC057013 TaxID=3345999 RepID=UPI0036404688
MTTRWWADTTLTGDFGVDGAATDDACAAMDWLAARQDGMKPGSPPGTCPRKRNPDRLALFDLSSFWVTGHK